MACCRITTAATWSITAREPRVLRPERCSALWALTVESRSSTSRTGAVGTAEARRAAKARASSVEAVSAPDSDSGRPTTIADAPNSAARAAIRATSAPSGASATRATVSTGTARRPSASQHATPMRERPTSMPSRTPNLSI